MWGRAWLCRVENKMNGNRHHAAAYKATHHQHSKVIMVGAMNGGGVAPGARYVAALCPPATVSIQQVKIPVGCGGVGTQREVPESDGDAVHGAPEAAPICNNSETFKE